MNSGEKTAIEPPVDLTNVTVPLCGDGPPTESLEVLPDTMKEEQFNKTMSDTVEDVLQQETMADAVPNKVKVPDTATPDLPHQVLLESVTEAEAAPAKKAEKAKSLLAGFHESFEMNMKLSQMTRR